MKRATVFASACLTRREGVMIGLASKSIIKSTFRNLSATYLHISS
jgi:hypothetical protein